MILFGHVRGPGTETEHKGSRAYSFELVERVQLDDEVHEKAYRVVAIISMLDADLVTPGMLFRAEGRPIGWRDQDLLTVALLADTVSPRDPWDHLLALRERDSGYDYWAAQPEEFWEEARAKREAELIRRAGGVVPKGGDLQVEEAAPAGGGLLDDVLLGLNSVALGEPVPELTRSIRRSSVKLEEGWAKLHNDGLMASVLGVHAVGEDMMRVYAQADSPPATERDAVLDEIDETDDMPVGNEYLLD